MQLVAAVVHTPEQVREIVTEALLITAEAEVDAHLERAVFEQSCQLLGARGTAFVQPQQIGIDLGALGNGRR